MKTRNANRFFALALSLIVGMAVFSFGKIKVNAGETLESRFSDESSGSVNARWLEGHKEIYDDEGTKRGRDQTFSDTEEYVKIYYKGGMALKDDPFVYYMKEEYDVDKDEIITKDKPIYYILNLDHRDSDVTSAGEKVEIGFELPFEPDVLNLEELKVFLYKDSEYVGYYTEESKIFYYEVYGKEVIFNFTSPAEYNFIGLHVEFKEKEKVYIAEDEVSPYEGTTYMYRMYNPNTGEHFYTERRKEGNSLVDAGWEYEGNGWIAPKGGDPVYRLYNEPAGDHHYTMSKRERDHLVKLGWRDEGIGWYSAPKDMGKPLYRLYNPNCTGSGSHHYTKSLKEVKMLEEIGWKNEGIAWYAYEDQQ